MLKTTNILIARPLSGSPVQSNELPPVYGPRFFPHFIQLMSHVQLGSNKSPEWRGLVQTRTRHLPESESTLHQLLYSVVNRDDWNLTRDIETSSTPLIINLYFQLKRKLNKICMIEIESDLLMSHMQIICS